MNLGLTDKVVIVTGSARGIGAVIAAEFAAEGARVVICDINAEAAEATAQTLRDKGGQAIAVETDIVRADSVAHLVDRTMETFGQIDVLVNNAGVVKDSLLIKMTEEAWDAVVDVTLKGTFLCTKAVMPIMAERRSGRIVNIASRAHHGNPGQANYSAAKAGLIGFTGSQAREQGRFNITVNCVAPGFIETPLVRALPHYEKIKAKTIENTPIPRLGREEDIADAVLFLASDRASWITGEVVHVTGGRYSN
ncbi:3-oxoacyl-[acyl-carrier protein] reductase [Rhodoligotrophos appendicifer]|uniref:3-oxoacyl-ACP reductase FabG n=1 Tax=Rhodoligotrophos appendicifer TaxID=987056 RepID=UPI0011868F78|nr:3-oxoacyl-ACP reductase FabG [Rhodoligotrophos appendicifer]